MGVWQWFGDDARYLCDELLKVLIRQVYATVAKYGIILAETIIYEHR